jgi:hypothetical protein
MAQLNKFTGNIETKDIVKPIRVHCFARTTSGEEIDRTFYTLSANPTTSVYNELTKIFNTSSASSKEKITYLCLRLI